MELLAENSTLSLWLMQYGCFAIFGLLVVGIIAFPVPEETLMVLAGILMSQGNLSIPSTLLAAFLGSICGISISYSIGRTAGHYVIHTFGKWIGLTEKRLQKAHAWTERFGTWTLFIGYFIPGLRHFTGFLAGTTDLEFNRFARFAYSGALLWILTFLSVGYFFGDYCVAFLSRFGSL
jgi:membrane protein DedA with SNARE-associated domain